MNTIKRLLTKIFLKMDKLQLLLLVATHYNNYNLTDPKDVARMKRVEKEIDFLVDRDIIPSLETGKNAVQPGKSEKPAVDTPTKPIGNTKPAGDKSGDNEKSGPDAGTKTAKTEIPKDVLVIVKPYYTCSVERGKNKEVKAIKFDGQAKLELPAFIDEKSAKQYNNVYPTVEELEMLLDEAWNMASEGKPNKDINALLAKHMGSMYASHGLKVDQDFYKISNDYSKYTKILRRAFDEGYDDTKVSTTRPSYTLFTESNETITLTKENDCSKAKVEEKKAEEKKAEPMKNVQTQKPAEKVKTPGTDETAKTKAATDKLAAEATEKVKATEKANDEESQESEETTEEATETVEETVEEVAEVQEAGAPKVNEFDDFNDIETLVYEKLREGNAKAAKEKDPAKQKAIKTEAKEDAKLLIQSNFNEDWTEKDEKGLWKPEMMKYWNAILKEIGTRANA